MTTVKRWWARFQKSVPWRVWQHYGEVRGNLLAGGVTYFAFFSIFPALALAFTIFGVVLQGNEQWIDAIKDYLNETLPGFVRDGDTGLIPIEAPSAATLNFTGLLGVAGLLWAGLGWLGALRDGIRTVFGAEGAPGNFVTAKLRDLAVLIILGLGIALSAAVSAIAGAAAQRVADRIGLGDQSWMLTIVGLIIGAVLDAGVVLIMLRLLSGVEVPHRSLLSGALFGGIALTLLKFFGTQLISSTTSNPLFASVVLVVGLMVWLNFMSRIVLLSASVAAIGLGLDQPFTEGQQAKLIEGPVPPEAADLDRAATAVELDKSAVPGTGMAPEPAAFSGAAIKAGGRLNLALGAVCGAVITAAISRSRQLRS